MISSAFNVVFYQPLYNALVFLTDFLPGHDVGLAVVILTIIVQFIIFPFRHKSVIAQRKMKMIEPEVRKIKDKYPKDKQEQTKQIMALYKEHGVSPFSGFLMILLQLPVFIALYKLFSSGINFNAANLYSFVSLSDIVQIKFLGLFDISKSNYIMAVIAGLTQFFQMKLSMPKTEKVKNRPETFQDHLARTMNIQARYIMPVFITFIALRFSSAIALYWTAMNVFAIVHEAIVAHKAKKAGQ